MLVSPSGRRATAQPVMQQIPIRTPEVARIRNAFDAYAHESRLGGVMAPFKPDPDPLAMIERTLADVELDGLHFELAVGLTANDVCLRAWFWAPDNTPGAGPEVTMQYTRNWPLRKDMTASEVVSTAFLCAITAREHELREQFKYKGAAVYGPHFDVNDLAVLAGGNHAI